MDHNYKIPVMPEFIGELIFDWLHAIESNKSDLLAIENWYDTLDVKHDNKKTYYRGINVSKKGFDTLINTGKLQLQKKLSESWTCRKSVAKRFASGKTIKVSASAAKIYTILGRGGASVILQKTVPKDKIWFNLDAIKSLYDQFSDRVIGRYNVSYVLHLIKDIKKFDECKLITKTVCTKCNIQDISEIRFIWDGSENQMGFLEMLGWSKENMKKVHIGYTLRIYQVRKGKYYMDILRTE